MKKASPEPQHLPKQFTQNPPKGKLQAKLRSELVKKKSRKKKLFCSHSLAFTSIIDGNEGSESFSLHMGLMYIKQYMCEQNLNG